MNNEKEWSFIVIDLKTSYPTIKNHRGFVMTADTIHATEEKITAGIETQRTSLGKAEICFGALMATAAITGIWGAVSLLISYFLN